MNMDEMVEEEGTCSGLLELSATAASRIKLYAARVGGY